MNKLSFDQICAITQGAVRIEPVGDAVSFFRFTKEQEELYQRTAGRFYERTFCTAGIKLEFRTDSPWLELDIEAIANTPFLRSYFSFDVFVNNELIGSLDNFSDTTLADEYVFDTYPLGRFRKRFELGSGNKLVAVYFPWSVKVLLHELCLEEKASVVSHHREKKLVTFGDSITQGYDALRPSARYGTKLAAAMGAEEICKAIGGECFSPDLACLADDISPDYITVAYGTNDWSGKERESVMKNCKAFFESLCRSYPKAKIFALTPIWRKDRDEDCSYGNFDLVEQDIRTCTCELPQITVIRGYDFVPKDSNYYADQRLHPNDKGFEAYAAHLIDAIS